MTNWFISRHPGAEAWMRQQPIRIDRWVSHLDPAGIAAGDLVYGSLPVSLAAQVCSRGARYFHLQLSLESESRGRELSPEQMEQLDARFCEFVVIMPMGPLANLPTS